MTCQPNMAKGSGPTARRRGRTNRPDGGGGSFPGTLPERADPAEDLVGAEGGGDERQVGAARRPGEHDTDDLGGFPDRAWVGLRVLLVGLLVGGEAEVRRELAD